MVGQLTMCSDSVSDQPTPGRPRVLVVEDDLKLASALGDALGRAGYEVTVATSGGDGLTAGLAQEFAVIVLDVMLPGVDGLTILKRLRAHGVGAPVLLLTARGGLDDRVDGLDAGADDYLVKPFALPELLARLRALARRPHGPTGRLTLEDLVVDRLARRATRGGRDLGLTPREFDILAYLLAQAGQTVSREMLARDVWEQDSRDAYLDNVIDVHLARLRRKVDHGGAPRLIQTVRGLGFVLRETPG